jgi:hypothetical protein
MVPGKMPFRMLWLSSRGKVTKVGIQMGVIKEKSPDSGDSNEDPVEGFVDRLDLVFSAGFLWSKAPPYGERHGRNEIPKAKRNEEEGPSWENSSHMKFKP